MIQKIAKLLLCFLLMIGFSRNVRATHTFGGDMSYKFIEVKNGFLIYKITMYVYVDRGNFSVMKPGLRPSEDIGIYYNDTTQGFGSKTITLYRLKTITHSLPKDTQTVSLVLPPGCTVPPPPITVLRSVYEDTIALPINDTNARKGYNIIYGISARINNINNISNAGSVGQTFYAYIPPPTIHNNSATFTKPPLPYVCALDTTSANNNATDDDGDKLIYSFMPPYNDAWGGNGPPAPPPPPSILNMPLPTIPYKTPNYSFAQQLGPGGYSYIDSLTGTTKYKAPITGIFATAIKIKEYRNGQLVGITTRDIQITSQPCTGSAPPPNYTSSNGKTEFYIKEGQNLCFPITFQASLSTSKLYVDKTGDLITNPTINPKPVFTGADTAVGTLTQNLCWNTICGQGKNDTYTFVVSATSGCPPKTRDLGFKIHVIPTKPIFSQEKITVCKYEQDTYAVIDTAKSTYAWTVTGGVPDVTTGNTIHVKWNLTGTKGKVICKETSKENCTGSDTLIILRDDNKLKISAGGKYKPICPNDSSTVLGPLPVGSAPTGTYVWTPTTGLNNGSSPNPKIFLDNTTGKNDTLKYILDVATADGCFSHDSVFVVVRAKPAMAASTPIAAICSGATAKVKCSNPPLTKLWYALPNTTTSIGNKDSVIVSPTITTTYLVVGTDGSGCTNSASVVVVVNPLPNVYIVLEAKDTLCVGQSTTLLALNATSYSWRSSSTGSTVISTSSTINVTPTITTTYTVSGTDNNGCSNSYSRQIYVNALPTPKISPTNNPICPGDSSVLRARNAANCSFTWYIKGKGGALATSVDSLLRVGPKDTVRYVVKAINKTTGCIAYDTLTLIVNPKPQPQLITGLNSVCPGQTGLFYTVNKAFSTSTYFWRVKGGYIPNGQVKNGSTIQINWNNVVDTNAYIKVVETNKYNCTGDTITLAMRVEIKLHPSLSTIQGKDSICSRDVNGVQYMVNPTLAGYNYTWTVVGGTVVSTGGVGGSTININWDPNTSITHSIQYKEDNGTCYGSTPVKSIRIDPSPFNNKMKGRLSVCNGEQSTYELAGLQGSIYYWKLSKHTRAKYYRNDSTATVVINWPDSSKSSTDTLYVLEKSNKGCVGDTIKAVITINPPHSPKKISGPDYVCVGSNPNQVPVEGYTANKGATGSRYVWTVIGAEKYPDSKDSILKVRFSKSGQGNVVTINVYEMTKDSCLGLSISKQVRFDYTLPYMQQVSTQYSNEHYLQIRWDSSVNAQNIGRNYKLYRRILHSNNPWQKVGTYYANTYTDQDTSLNTGKYAYEYYYSTLDLCDDTVLAPGHNSILLQAKADEDKNTVSLNWTPYKGWRGAVKQYEVWRKMDSERDYSLYKTLSNVDTSVSYNNGTDGFTHRYRIRAVEDGSEQPRESWSNGAVVSFSHPIDIPTVFTPNGDGVNDTWVIKNMETYHQAEIQVFNRWGNEVFSNTGTYNNNWDGSSNGQKLPTGTYFFVVKLNQKVVEGAKDTYSGTITVVR